MNLKKVIASILTVATVWSSTIAPFAALADGMEDIPQTQIDELVSLNEDEQNILDELNSHEEEAQQEEAEPDFVVPEEDVTEEVDEPEEEQPAEEPEEQPEENPEEQPEENPEEQPEEEEPSEAYTASAEPLVLYARVGEIAVSYLVKVSGGSAPYAIEATEGTTGAVVSSAVLAEDGSVELSYMPENAGSCVITVKVTDAEGREQVFAFLVPVSTDEHETAEQMKKDAIAYAPTDDWSANLVRVTYSQLYYTESKNDFIVDANGTHNYSRYGAWAGSPYGAWNAAFVKFCLNFAQVKPEYLPYDSNFVDWAKKLDDRGLLFTDSYAPAAGDLVFFENSKGDPCRVGIVTGADANSIMTVQGDCDGKVAARSYELTDKDIYGFVSMETVMKRAGVWHEPEEEMKDGQIDEVVVLQPADTATATDEGEDVEITEDEDSETVEIAEDEDSDTVEITENEDTETVEIAEDEDTETVEIAEDEDSETVEIAEDEDTETETEDEQPALTAPRMLLGAAPKGGTEPDPFTGAARLYIRKADGTMIRLDGNANVTYGDKFDLVVVMPSTMKNPRAINLGSTLFIGEDEDGTPAVNPNGNPNGFYAAGVKANVAGTMLEIPQVCLASHTDANQVGEHYVAYVYFRVDSQVGASYVTTDTSSEFGYFNIVPAAYALDQTKDSWNGTKFSWSVSDTVNSVFHNYGNLSGKSDKWGYTAPEKYEFTVSFRNNATTHTLTGETENSYIDLSEMDYWNGDLHIIMEDLIAIWGAGEYSVTYKAISGHEDFADSAVSQRSVYAVGNAYSAPVIDSFTTGAQGQLTATAHDAETGIEYYAFSTFANSSAAEADRVMVNYGGSSVVPVGSPQTFTTSFTAQTGSYYFYVWDFNGNVTQYKVGSEAKAISRFTVTFHNYYINDTLQSKVIYLCGDQTASPEAGVAFMRSGYELLEGTYFSNQACTNAITEFSSLTPNVYVGWKMVDFASSLTLTCASYTKTYDGTPVVVSALAESAGLDVEYTWYKGIGTGGAQLGEPVTKTAGEPCVFNLVNEVEESGDYTVSAIMTIPDQNEPVTAIKTFHIEVNPAVVTVVLSENPVLIYGDTLPEYVQSNVPVEGKVAYTVSGLIAGDEGETVSVEFTYDGLNDGVEMPDVGEYDILIGGTVTGGNYVVEPAAEYTLTVNPIEVSDDENENPHIEIHLGSADSATYTYDGESHKPNTIVAYVYNDGELIERRTLSANDFDVSYVEQGTTATSDCVDAGTYSAVVTLKGNYSGSGSIDFVIEPATVDAHVEISGWEYDSTWNNNGAESPRLVCGEKIPGTDIAIPSSSDKVHFHVAEVIGEGEGKTYREILPVKDTDTYDMYAPINAGTYAVWAEIDPENENYTTTVTEKEEYKITPRRLTIIAGSLVAALTGEPIDCQDYDVDDGVAEHNHDYWQTNGLLVGTDTLIGVVCRAYDKSGTPSDCTEKGEYVNKVETVNISTGSENNYEIEKVDGVISVGMGKLPAPAAIAWNNKKPGNGYWNRINTAPGLEIAYELTLQSKGEHDTIWTNEPIGANGETTLVLPSNISSYDFSELIRQGCLVDGRYQAKDFRLGIVVKEVTDAAEPAFEPSDAKNSGLLYTAVLSVENSNENTPDAVKQFTPAEKVLLINGETVKIGVELNGGYDLYKENDYIWFSGDDMLVRNRKLTSTYVTAQLTSSGERTVTVDARDRAPQIWYTEAVYSTKTDNAVDINFNFIDEIGVLAAAVTKQVGENGFPMPADDEFHYYESPVQHGNESFTVTEPGNYFVVVKDANNVVCTGPFVVHEISFHAEYPDERKGSGDVPVASLLKLDDYAVVLPDGTYKESTNTGFGCYNYTFRRWKYTDEHGATSYYFANGAFNENGDCELWVDWKPGYATYKVRHFYQLVADDNTLYYAEVPDLVESYVLNRTTANPMPTVSFDEDEMLLPLGGFELDMVKCNGVVRTGDDRSLVLDEKNDKNESTANNFDVYYKRKIYNVSWTAEIAYGSVVMSETLEGGVPYGAKIPLQPWEGSNKNNYFFSRTSEYYNQVKGKDFNGWYYQHVMRRPSTMPMHDVKFTGEFVPAFAQLPVHYYVENPNTGEYEYVSALTESMFLTYGSSIKMELDARTRTNDDGEEIIEQDGAQYAKTLTGVHPAGVRIKVLNNGQSVPATYGSGCSDRSVNGRMGYYEVGGVETSVFDHNTYMVVEYFYDCDIYDLTLDVVYEMRKDNPADTKHIFTLTVPMKYGERLDLINKHKNPADYLPDDFPNKDNLAPITCFADMENVARYAIGAEEKPENELWRQYYELGAPKYLDGHGVAEYRDWSSGLRPEDELGMPANNITVTCAYVLNEEVPYTVNIWYRSAQNGSISKETLKAMHGDDYVDGVDREGFLVDGYYRYTTMDFLINEGMEVTVGYDENALDNASSRYKLNMKSFNTDPMYNRYTYTHVKMVPDDNYPHTRVITNQINGDGSYNYYAHKVDENGEGKLVVDIYLERETFPVKINYIAVDENGQTLFAEKTVYNTAWGESFDFDPLQYFEANSSVDVTDAQTRNPVIKGSDVVSTLKDVTIGSSGLDGAAFDFRNNGYTVAYDVNDGWLWYTSPAILNNEYSQLDNFNYPWQGGVTGITGMPSYVMQSESDLTRNYYRMFMPGIVGASAELNVYYMNTYPSYMVGVYVHDNNLLKNPRYNTLVSMTVNGKVYGIRLVNKSDVFNCTVTHSGSSTVYPGLNTHPSTANYTYTGGLQEGWYALPGTDATDDPTTTGKGLFIWDGDDEGSHKITGSNVKNVKYDDYAYLIIDRPKWFCGYVANCGLSEAQYGGINTYLGHGEKGKDSSGAFVTEDAYDSVADFYRMWEDYYAAHSDKNNPEQYDPDVNYISEELGGRSWLRIAESPNQPLDLTPNGWNLKLRYQPGVNLTHIFRTTGVTCTSHSMRKGDFADPYSLFYEDIAGTSGEAEDSYIATYERPGFEVAWYNNEKFEVDPTASPAKVYYEYHGREQQDGDAKEIPHGERIEMTQDITVYGRLEKIAIPNKGIIFYQSNSKYYEIGTDENGTSYGVDLGGYWSYEALQFAKDNRSTVVDFEVRVLDEKTVSLTDMTVNVGLTKKVPKRIVEYLYKGKRVALEEDYPTYIYTNLEMEYKSCSVDGVEYITEGYHFDSENVNNWLKDYCQGTPVVMKAYMALDKYTLVKHANYTGYVEVREEYYVGQEVTLEEIDSTLKPGYRNDGWVLYESIYDADNDTWSKSYTMDVDEEGEDVKDYIRITDVTPEQTTTPLGNVTVFKMPGKNVYAEIDWAETKINYVKKHFYADANEEFATTVADGLLTQKEPASNWAIVGDEEEGEHYTAELVGSDGVIYTADKYVISLPDEDEPADYEFRITYIKKNPTQTDFAICVYEQCAGMTGDKTRTIDSFRRDGGRNDGRKYFKYDSLVTILYRNNAFEQTGYAELYPDFLKPCINDTYEFYYLPGEFTLRVKAMAIDGSTMSARPTINGRAAALTAEWDYAEMYGLNAEYVLRALQPNGYSVIGWYNMDDIVVSEDGRTVTTADDGKSLTVREGAEAISTNLTLTGNLYYDTDLVLLLSSEDLILPQYTIVGKDEYIYNQYPATEKIYATRKAATSGVEPNYNATVTGYTWYEKQLVEGVETWVEIPGQTTVGCVFDAGLPMELTPRAVGEYTYKVVVHFKSNDTGRTADVESDPFTLSIVPRGLEFGFFGYKRLYDGNFYRFENHCGGGTKLFGDDRNIRVFVTLDERSKLEEGERTITIDEMLEGGEGWHELTEETYSQLAFRDANVEGYKVYYYYEILPSADGTVNFTVSDDQIRTATAIIEPLEISIEGIGELTKIYDGTSDLTAENKAEIETVLVTDEDSGTRSNGMFRVYGLLPGDSETYCLVVNMDESSYTDDSGKPATHVGEATQVVLGKIGIIRADGRPGNYIIPEDVVCSIDGSITPRDLHVVWMDDTDSTDVTWLDASDTSTVVPWKTEEGGSVTFDHSISLPDDAAPHAYVFDANVHTLPARVYETYETTGLELFNNEHPKLTVSGTGEKVQEKPYNVKATLDSDESLDYRAGDYLLHFDEAQFVITRTPITIRPLATEITGDYPSRVRYDGVKHTFNDFEITGLPEGFNLQAVTTQTSSANVGLYEIAIRDDYTLEITKDGRNYKNNFIITLLTAPLTIEPAVVWVDGMEAEDKEYDGTTGVTLIPDAVTVHGIVGSESVTIDGIEGAFVTADVGDDKSVALDYASSELIKRGQTAANYVLDLFAEPLYDGEFEIKTQLFTQANIIPAPLTAVFEFPDIVYGQDIAVTVTYYDKSGNEVDAREVTGNVTFKLFAGTGFEFVTVVEDGVSVTRRVASTNGPVFTYTANAANGIFEEGSNSAVYVIPYDSAAENGWPNANKKSAEKEVYLITPDVSGLKRLKPTANGGEANMYSFSSQDTTLYVNKRPVDVNRNSLIDVTQPYMTKTYDGTTDTTEAQDILLVTVAYQIDSVDGVEESGRYKNETVGLSASNNAYDDPNVLDCTEVAATNCVLDTISDRNYVLVKDWYTVPAKIKPLAIELTPDELTKVYGDPDPEFTYSTDPALEIVMVTPSGIDITRTPGETVGDYRITAAANAAMNPNYTITTVSGEHSVLHIVKRPLTVSPAPAEKTITYGTLYGSTEFPAYTLKAEGWADSWADGHKDSETYHAGVESITDYYADAIKLTADLKLDVPANDDDTYTVSADINMVTLDDYVKQNYEIFYETSTLTVMPVIVVVVDGKVKANDKSYDCTPAATLAEDTLTSDNGAITCADQSNQNVLSHDNLKLKIDLSKITATFQDTTLTVDGTPVLVLAKNVGENKDVKLVYGEGALVICDEHGTPVVGNKNYKLDPAASQQKTTASITPVYLHITPATITVTYGTDPADLPAMCSVLMNVDELQGADKLLGVDKLLEGMHEETNWSFFNFEEEPYTDRTRVTKPYSDDDEGIVKVANVTALYGNYIVIPNPGVMVIQPDHFDSPEPKWNRDEPGVITWDDVQPIGGIEPKEFEVMLLKDGVTVATVTVTHDSASDSYSYDFSDVIHGVNGGAGEYTVSVKTIADPAQPNVKDALEGNLSDELFAANVIVSFANTSDTVWGDFAGRDWNSDSEFVSGSTYGVKMVRQSDSATAEGTTATILLIAGETASVNASLKNDTGYLNSEYVANAADASKVLFSHTGTEEGLQNAPVDKDFLENTTVPYTITLDKGLASANDIPTLVEYTKRPGTLLLAIEMVYEGNTATVIEYDYDVNELKFVTTPIPDNGVETLPSHISEYSGVVPSVNGKDNLLASQYTYEVSNWYYTKAPGDTSKVNVTTLVWDNGDSATLDAADIFPSGLHVVNNVGAIKLYPVDCVVTATRQDNGEKAVYYNNKGKAFDYLIGRLIVEVIPAKIYPMQETKSWTYGEERSYDLIKDFTARNPEGKQVDYYYSDTKFTGIPPLDIRPKDITPYTQWRAQVLASGNLKAGLPTEVGQPGETGYELHQDEFGKYREYYVYAYVHPGDDHTPGWSGELEQDIATVRIYQAQLDNITHLSVSNIQTGSVPIYGLASWDEVTTFLATHGVNNRNLNTGDTGNLYENGDKNNVTANLIVPGETGITNTSFITPTYCVKLMRGDEPLKTWPKFHANIVNLDLTKYLTDTGTYTLRVTAVSDNATDCLDSNPSEALFSINYALNGSAHSAPPDHGRDMDTRTYDGTPTVLSISCLNNEFADGAELTYTWFVQHDVNVTEEGDSSTSFSYEVAAVTSEPTLLVYDVKDSGRYICVISGTGKDGQPLSCTTTSLVVTIVKRVINIIADDSSKVFDSTPLANPGFIVTDQGTTDEGVNEGTAVTPVTLPNSTVVAAGSKTYTYVDYIPTVSTPARGQMTDGYHVVTVMMKSDSHQTDAHTDKCPEMHFTEKAGYHYNVIDVNGDIPAVTILRVSSGETETVDATENYILTVNQVSPTDDTEKYGVLKVTKKPLSDVDVIIDDIDTVTYNGLEYKPEPVVTYTTVAVGEDGKTVVITVAKNAYGIKYVYENNLESDYVDHDVPAKVTVKPADGGESDYCSEQSVTFNILRRNLRLMADSDTKTYDGAPLYNTGFHFVSGTTLDDGLLSKLTFANVARNTSLKSATATTENKLHVLTVYMTDTSCQTDAFTDHRKAETDPTFAVNDAGYQYNVINASKVTIKRGTVDATANYIIVVNDDGDDAFDPAKDYGLLKVEKKPLGDDDVSMVKPEDVYYDGEEHKPTPTVTYAPANESELTLSEVTDFDYTYTEDYADAIDGRSDDQKQNTMDIGTVTVTAQAPYDTGTVANGRNYCGSIEQTFEVMPRPITVTAADSHKVYDHTPLTYAGFTVESMGLDNRTLTYDADLTTPVTDVFAQKTQTVTTAGAYTALHVAYVTMTETSTVTNVYDNKNGAADNNVIIPADSGTDGSFRIVRELDGADVTANYAITLNPGAIWIDPMAVTVKMNDIRVVEGDTPEWAAYWNADQTGYSITSVQPTVDGDSRSYSFDDELIATLLAAKGDDAAINCDYSLKDTRVATSGKTEGFTGGAAADYTQPGTRPINMFLPDDKNIGNFAFTVNDGTIFITSGAFKGTVGQKTLWAYESTYTGAHLGEDSTTFDLSDSSELTLTMVPETFSLTEDDPEELMKLIGGVIGEDYSLFSWSGSDAVLKLESSSTVTRDKATAGYDTANSTVGFTFNGADGKDKAIFTIEAGATKADLLVQLFNYNALTQPEIGTYTVVLHGITKWDDGEGNEIIGDDDVITLTFVIKAVPAQLKVSVPLVLVLRTNIDGGTASPEETGYAIDNASSMRVQLFNTVETPVSEFVAPADDVSGEVDKYHVTLKDEVGADGTLTTAHDIAADGTAGNADLYNPIASVSVSRLSFVTSHTPEGITDNGKADHMVDLTYSVRIPKDDPAKN